ncbi:DUF3558 domain-containing protein [Nocardia amikacinitolerans]|uniref:DUF3558 domain-containing protein n=1 Tax=Nocardia amikacinitolerans TaxID=756689 RepID=UPI0020A56BE2|nr:DUF3558 domain-containing protein [Nocardia amikacinitolerans]MCP2288154.1 Protein of unknown function (DUF3558) [Nocardia amikacinitolerans]
MTRRIVGMMLGAAVVFGAVGCGGTTEGTPSTSAAQPALWNPCAEIPDDVLRASGVDPATEESGVAGVHQSGWEICGWIGKSYAITVYSTRRTVAEFEKKPGNVDFRDVTVGGRDGRQFRVEGASKNLHCDVLFPVSQGGVLQLSISNRASLDNPEDPCTVLPRVGELLVPVFPN